MKTAQVNELYAVLKVEIVQIDERRVKNKGFSRIKALHHYTLSIPAIYMVLKMTWPHAKTAQYCLVEPSFQNVWNRVWQVTWFGENFARSKIALQVLSTKNAISEQIYIALHKARVDISFAAGARVIN